MKVNRWGALAAGCLIQASSGLNYSFSILAPSFRDWLGFSDAQLALIAGSINLGGYLAIPSGILYDKLQHRHNLGPRVVIWVGCVLMTMGYGGMWAQAAGVVPASLGCMLLCGILSGNAGTWWDTSVLVTSVRNFPDDRGSVLGILKAFLGLSTSIYASMYWALFAVPPHSTPPSPASTSAIDSSDSSGATGSTTHGMSHSLAPLDDAPAGALWSHQFAGLTIEAARAASHGITDDGSSSVTWQGYGGWSGGADAGGDGSTRGPMAFLVVLALVPSLLNFLGSLFMNQVPAEYHEHERAPLTPGPSTQAAGITQPGLPAGLPASSQGAAGPMTVVLVPHEHTQHHLHGGHHHPRVNKGARFLGLYILISVVAILQAGGTLSGKGGVPGSEVEKLHAAVLLVLLCLVMLLPVSAGPLLRQSLRHGQRGSQDQLQSLIEPQPDSAPRAGSAPQPASATLQLEPERVPLIYAAYHHIGAGNGHEPPAGGEQGSEHGRSESEAEECESEDVDKEEAPPVQSMTAGQALRQATFWALFLALLSSSASGLTLLNNLAPLVISLGGHKGAQVAFVSLFSVANASGRLLFGHLSEHYLHRLGVPRPVFLLLANGTMTACMAALSVGVRLHALYGLSLAIGLAFGGHWSAVPAVATDLFGLDSFAGIYCCLQFAPAAGVLYFASWLAGHNLAEAARLPGGADPSGECVGLACFAGTWRALLVLNVVSLSVVLWLWQRTRAPYATSHAAHTASCEATAADGGSSGKG